MQAMSRTAMQCVRQVGMARGGSQAAKRAAVQCAAGGKKQQKRTASTRGGSGSGSGSGSSSGGRGGGGPPAATDTARLLSSPLTNRHLLAEKLTETAKNIVWLDLVQDRPVEATREQIAALQERLGYRFSNKWLLRLALIHSSAATNTHNSIMAWIGDAALYLIVAEEVGSALGNVPIGKLSEIRKMLIGRIMCERYANHLGLGQYLVIGKSVRVQQAGQPSRHMLAEQFEAVMGAIYLDGDLEAVRRVYITHFPLPADPLTLLQEGEGCSGSSPDGGKAADSSPWE